MRIILILLSFMVPTLAFAQSGDDVPLPRQRPEAATGSPLQWQVLEDGEQIGADETNAEPAYTGPPLPRKRPDNIEIMQTSPHMRDSEDVNHEQGSKPAPARIYQTACPAVLNGQVIGKVQPPIIAPVCSIRSPFEVTGVRFGGHEVEFTAPATLNCQMATELANWVARVSTYTEAIYNAPVSTLKMGTSYMCRPRNNVAGADVSEHGFGNAVDVTGFVLENGEHFDLPSDWQGNGAEARVMRHAHDAACGYFTTVLGPDANALHHDHLHLDLGCHGRTCTARLCE